MNQIEVIQIGPDAFAVCGPGQYQPHDPEMPGFVPMDRDRAEAVAEATRAQTVLL